MKSKTIKSIISNKIKKWSDSIEDEKVKKLVQKNTIVTGGCIASLLLNEPVNDFDIYFRDKETTLAVAEYYLNKFKEQNPRYHNCKLIEEDDRIKIMVPSSGIAEGNVLAEDPEFTDVMEEIEKEISQSDSNDLPGYRPVFLSTNAITLSNKIQIVIRFFGDPDTLHENYDYIHCTNYWTSDNKELVLKPKAMEALLTKELTYVGSKYPICSIIRLRKFIRRGWTINAGQILKICMQIGDLDLTDPKVLEDQLTGVDSAYFMQVIRDVKEKDESKINHAYLVEIIDRIF